MPSIIVRKITKDASGVRIRFAASPADTFGKEEVHFASLREAQEFARSQLSRDTLKALVIAMLIERQPDIDNPALIEGRSLNVNLAVNNWGTVTVA